MAADGTPGCQGSLQGLEVLPQRGGGYKDKHTDSLCLGLGGTQMLAELGLTPHPKMWAQPGVRWMGTHQGSSTAQLRHWLCPVPSGSPGGAWTPPLTSWTRVVWQFLRSGPCSSTLGAPGCNESIILGAGGTPCALSSPPLSLRSPGAG